MNASIKQRSRSLVNQITNKGRKRKHICTFIPLSTSFAASHAAHFFTKVVLSCSFRLKPIPFVESDESGGVGESIVNICSSGSTTKESTYVPSARLFHFFFLGEKGIKLGRSCGGLSHQAELTYPTKTSTTFFPSPYTFHISSKAPQRFNCASTGAKIAGRNGSAGPRLLRDAVCEGWELCCVCDGNVEIEIWESFDGYICDVEPGREGGRELDRETGRDEEVDGAEGGGANNAKKE